MKNGAPAARFVLVPTPVAPVSEIELPEGRKFRVRRLPHATGELIGNKKLSRELSRAGELLVFCVKQLSVLNNKSSDSQTTRIGVYCALEPGSINFDIAAHLANPGAKAAEVFEKHCAPKQHLVSTASMGAAHVGIQLGTRGPIHSFTDTRYACEHAYQQAKVDLEDGIVDQAVLASSWSGDDALHARAIARQFETVLEMSEGAAALMLSRDESLNLLPDPDDYSEPSFYSIAHPLMREIRKMS